MPHTIHARPDNNGEGAHASDIEHRESNRLPQVPQIGANEEAARLTCGGLQQHRTPGTRPASPGARDCRERGGRTPSVQRPTIERQGRVPGEAGGYSVRATSTILYASSTSPTLMSWNFSMPKPHS